MDKINQQPLCDFANFFNLDWEKYKSELDFANKEKEEESYNIISISTYSGHLENYHSDVWRFLLDSKSAHKKGNLFLSLFIDYLVSNFKDISLKDNKIEHLKEAEVYREKGRIDLLIVNESEGICIIIENKINNAQDQYQQMPRYKIYAEKKGWTVSAILYVSLFGNTLTTIEDGNFKVQPVAASNGNNEGLLKGWLIPCKNSISNAQEKDENVTSFIHQYCMLLKHLTSKYLINMSITTLYDYLKNDKNNFQTALFIQEQLENLALERLDIFKNGMEKKFEVTDYYHNIFGRITSYPGYPNHMIFEKYKYKGDFFQLDIVHYKNRTRFTLYNPTRKFNAENAIAIFNDILGTHDFVADREDLPHHINFTISLNEEIETLSMLDEATINFAVMLFTKMKQFKPTN